MPENEHGMSNSIVPPEASFNNISPVPEKSFVVPVAEKINESSTTHNKSKKEKKVEEPSESKPQRKKSSVYQRNYGRRTKVEIFLENNAHHLSDEEEESSEEEQGGRRRRKGRRRPHNLRACEFGEEYAQTGDGEWIIMRDDRPKDVVVLGATARVPFCIQDDIIRYVELKENGEETDDEIEDKRDFINKKLAEKGFCRFDSLLELSEFIKHRLEKETDTPKKRKKG
eukprot:UN32380